MILTDQEFDSRQVALDDVLTRHLGPAHEDGLDAEFVMMALWLPASGLGAMNPRQEREKLAKLERLARELAIAWNSLSTETRTQMELLSSTIHETTGPSGVFRSRDPLSLQIVSVLDHLVSATAPLANHVIDTAPIAGRRDLLSVGIVERLRDVWAERKGSDAPKSMTEAGPFADFIFEAFETLSITGNPRAAMDSWREFRARHPSSE